jgi:hypothetical protein
MMPYMARTTTLLIGDGKDEDLPGEHDDGPRIRLPAHAPEVVPRRVERSLQSFKF